jgi:hypothetical protein
VIAGESEHYGPDHVETLLTKGNLAILLDEKKTPESVEEAERLYREVIAGESEHYGPNHVSTLRTKGNLANLLKNKGTPESVEEASEVVRYGGKQSQKENEVGGGGANCYGTVSLFGCTSLPRYLCIHLKI